MEGENEITPTAPSYNTLTFPSLGLDNPVEAEVTLASGLHSGEVLPSGQPTQPNYRAMVIGGRVVWVDTSAELDADTTSPLEGDLVDAEIGDEHTIFPDHRTKVINHMIAGLYNKAEENDPRTSCFERCTDSILQDASFKRLFLKQRDVLLSDTLRRGRAAGWAMLSQALFPLMHNVVRDVWVVIGTAIALILLSLSITALALGRDKSFNFILFSFTVLFMILTLADGLYTLRSCKSCKWCYGSCKRGRYSLREREPYFKCCTRRGLSFARNATDITRILLYELLLYPILICAFFEVVTGRGFESRSHISIIASFLLILSGLAFILYVYVARIVLIAGTLTRIYKTRTLNKSATSLNNPPHSRHFTSKTSVVSYHIYTAVQMVFQMLVQVLMIVAIAARIRFENNGEKLDSDGPVHVSGFLWYMIAAAYITPYMGLGASLIVTYYWMQQYPIGLCIDMVRIWKLKMPNQTEHICDILGYQQGIIQWDTIARKINRFLNIQILKTEFDNLCKKSWCSKFVYPFTIPTIAALCIFYLITQIAFIGCAILNIDQNHITVQILDGGEWSYYCIAALIFWAIANGYTLALAFFWIFSIILSCISLFLWYFPCCCVVIVSCINRKYFNK